MRKYATKYAIIFFSPKVERSDTLEVPPPLRLYIRTLCGSERVLVVSTEPPDDLSCLTTPGVGRPGDGAVARAVDPVHPDVHSESMRGFADSSTDLCALGCASAGSCSCLWGGGGQAQGPGGLGGRVVSRGALPALRTRHRAVLWSRPVRQSPRVDVAEVGVGVPGGTAHGRGGAGDGEGGAGMAPQECVPGPEITDVRVRHPTGRGILMRGVRSRTSGP